MGCQRSVQQFFDLVKTTANMYAVYQRPGLPYIQISAQLFNIGAQRLFQHRQLGLIKVPLAKYPHTEIAAAL